MKDNQSNNILDSDFFSASLAERDAAISLAITSEFNRQQKQIELIASENIVSRAVLEAQGSVLTNKYAEGYPSKRYYGGCEFVDRAEELAVERATSLFECGFANVQPHSGAQANQTVFMALLEPGDTILGMSLAAGGHLTHGAKPNQSGKWFNAVQYGVKEKDALIDYDEVEALSKEFKPKLIVAGGSAYSRIIDFQRFRKVADAIGATLLVDMAHFSGLVAGGVHPSPFPHAHVATSTTHKTLRGPRGGMILTNDGELAQKINSALFPGLQGGPLMHVIAAKAVAFWEAQKPAYKFYVEQVVENAAMLAKQLKRRDISIVTGGTDTHLVLVDLRSLDITGRQAEAALEAVGITCNKNGIPFDREKPTITSGIRLGTPAGTTRGFKKAEFMLIANLIADVLYHLSQNGRLNEEIIKRIKNAVQALCVKFPIY